MDLLEAISDQMTANSLPLVAITVAAVPCPDTPVILTLHWHGFVEEKIIDLEQAATVAYTPVPSSALQVNYRWKDLGTLDCAAMEAGWKLGAWDVARAERGGCVRPGAETSESIECLQAFGAFPFGLNGQQVVVSEAPDAEDLVNLAARRGYLMWMFRPVHRGIWADYANDATLHADGTRTPPCPINPIPPAGAGQARTVYRFGIPGNTQLLS
ncbi:MAG TPA: diguanylate cyclase [Burkholderiales bacterium]